jgi:hypothetical protein
MPAENRRDLRNRVAGLPKRRDMKPFFSAQLSINHPTEMAHLLPESKSPNKAPEPTPGLVTPRAMEFASEMKRRNKKRDAARLAPSPVVAHL